jgi:hypothetical protein
MLAIVLPVTDPDLLSDAPSIVEGRDAGMAQHTHRGIARHDL